MTIREAIRRSVNVVAVKTMVDITPSLGFSYLKNFGFTTLVENQVNADGTSFTDIGYALALGGITKGVTNLEMTASYAAIANGGVYTQPILYTKVLDHNGVVLLDNQPEKHRVIKETTAFLLTNAMRDVVTGGTGTATAIPGMMSVGKTGSTSDYNDVWFVGYTPYYTAGIWSGYDENKPQSGSYASYHRAFWSKIMTKVHEGLENKDFPVPDGIERATICAKSGKLPVDGVCNSDPRGSMLRTEYFAKGTVPTEYCENHIRITVCNESGQIAGEFCPPESVSTRVFISAEHTNGNAGGTAASVGNSGDTPYMMPSSLNVPCTIHLEAATVPIETNPDGTPVETVPQETNPDGTPVETVPVPQETNPDGTPVEIETTTQPEEPTTTLPEPESIEGPSGPESGQNGPWNDIVQ